VPPDTLPTALPPAAARRFPSLPDVGPLDGPAERAGFAPGLTVGLGLVAGFLLFQLLSLAVALGLIVLAGGLGDPAEMDIGALIDRFASEFLIANTVGQVLGLGVFAWFLARLHTRRAGRFLRVRASDARFAALTVVGLLLLVPVVQWLGTWSDSWPWPEWVRSFEATQLDLIEKVLTQNLGFAFTLFTMAVTPAVCEELFFRGYIQRQAERMFGGWIGAVVFSGVVFGLYHVRPTQALPLSLLGVYLAYVTWRSGSLVPAILVHFANNGLAVVLGAIVSARPDMQAADLERLAIPVYIVLPAAILFAGLAWVLHTRFRRREVEFENHHAG
jgi:hypothetical protein